jgi:hypothetical protein
LIRRLYRCVALLLLACAQPTAARPCSAADVNLSAHWQGATGALAGGLRIDLTAPDACTLPGQLQIDLLDAQGEPMTVDEVFAEPEPSVVLQPTESAFVRLIWRNWCGPPPDEPVSLAVTLPTDAQPVSATIADAPRCDDPTAPSTLAVGPVEKLT